MDDLERRKDVLKTIHCFTGPVREAFVYIYYQTYTQDTDVYTYAVNNDKEDLFTTEELTTMENDKRPNCWPFSLLYKVLRTCCSPVLAQNDDPIWQNSTAALQMGLPYCKVEDLLSILATMYKEFLRGAHSITEREISSLIRYLNKIVSLLIEKTSELVENPRMVDEQDRINNLFSDIKSDRHFILGKKNAIDLVQVEVDFRVELYKELLADELKKCDEFSWHLERFTFSESGEIREESAFEFVDEVEPKSILETVNESGKKIVWIAGEHGIGKSSFAASIVTSWRSGLNEVPGLEKFSAVVAISLIDLQNSSFEDDNNVLRLILPLTSQVVSKEALEEWLHHEKILIILDDVNRHSEAIIKEIYELTENVPNLMVWFMGRMTSLVKYIEQPCYAVRSTFFDLKGLRERTFLSVCQSIDEITNSDSLTLRIKENMIRLAPLLKYPPILNWTTQLWKENARSFKSIYSASDLMWQILAWNVRKTICINIIKLGKMRKKFLQWLMQAGELALYSLKADHRLDGVLLNELSNEIANLFSENARRIITFMFRPTISHSFTGCFSTPASTCKPFLEYLSSWYFVDQLLNDKPLNQMTEGLVNQLPLILFAAGHMERFQDQGTVTISEERKVIKALVNYRQNSYDDFGFIQKFVAEMRCIRRLVQIVVDETEYNEEWNLNISQVQAKPMKVLLSHVSPLRLIFLANEAKKNYELVDVMKYVCRVDISVWLDSVPLFNYGCKQRLDNLITPFLCQDVIPRLDLLSGSLSSSAMQELSKFKCTKHLVLLRLKVNSEKGLRTALTIPSELPNLLWLEIKIDMNVKDIKVSHLRPTNVPLFDVYMRELEDIDVTFVASLLSAMHNKYTGIHLEETNLTPEGVYTLLRELGKRNVSLRGLETDIVKFRRWYYCSLNSIPSERKLTEQDCIDIIGHDDRGFFSDHHVFSSQFVTSIDAWNLRSYLEAKSNIIKFTYEASNILFSKSLDGEVVIDFKGAYKENIEKKVMNGKDPSMKEDVHKEVLAFY